MSRITIDRKIVGYRVERRRRQGSLSKKAEKPGPRRLQTEGNVVRMHEKLERPEMLQGSTYKVKTPVSDHAMRDHQRHHTNPAPSTSSAGPSRFSSTRRTSTTTSGSWRSRGSCRPCSARAATSLSWWTKLKAVFDPRGGYWQPGGKFMRRSSRARPHREAPAVHRAAADGHRRRTETLKLIELKRKGIRGAASPAGRLRPGRCCEGGFPRRIALNLRRLQPGRRRHMDSCMTCLSCGDSSADEKALTSPSSRPFTPPDDAARSRFQFRRRTRRRRSHARRILVRADLADLARGARAGGARHRIRGAGGGAPTWPVNLASLECPGDAHRREGGAPAAACSAS